MQFQFHLAVLDQHLLILAKIQSVHLILIVKETFIHVVLILPLTKGVPRCINLVQGGQI